MTITCYFWDTSAIVKRYFAETGSQTVNRLFSIEQSRHFASQLMRAEVTSAIARRAERTHTARRLLEGFTHDLAVQVDLMGLDDDLVDAGVDLIGRHRLRGCDALHLASALRVYAELNRDFAKDESAISLAFVCADDDLNAAAVAEGLTIDNPNHHA
jgi:hypothetical protein